MVFEEVPETYRNSDQREYLKIKLNVDRLKIIQIGITLSDENGNVPEPVSTWQFNFNFDLDIENKSMNSIKLLQDSGIDFQKLKRHGIHPLYFAEKVTASGLVLNDKVHWICFHGSYDFAYLLKIMMNEMLPKTKDAFYHLLKTFFPNIYDIKSFQNEFSIDSGGLNKIAEQLNLTRVGITHQAGSDSLLTQQIFFKLKESYLSTFHATLADYNQDIYGISNDTAYPSMSRAGPNPLHSIDPLAIHPNMEGADMLGNAEGVHGASQSHHLHSHFSAPAGELYFNLAGTATSATEYDNNYFYQGINSTTQASAAGIEPPVLFQPSLRGQSVLSATSSAPTYGQAAHSNYAQSHFGQSKQSAAAGGNAFMSNKLVGMQGNPHLMQSSTTPPPMMLDNQMLYRNLTPNQSHGIELMGHQQYAAQPHHIHQQQSWNYFNGPNVNNN